MKNLTQYKKRQSLLSEKEKEKEKEIRRVKDRLRSANLSEEQRAARNYKKYLITARFFLKKYIKEEDKEEFREILKEL